VSVVRFEPLSRPSRILSLSFWRDEEAMARRTVIAQPIPATPHPINMQPVALFDA
jgi:hypothetical protein